ncbi:MAG: helix-turn-helix domain-containing protein [Deltaproteobacteria bacterium]|nr:helix-turn-helix domain-containing protein [Deltaproteobacteria bacterium]
MNKNISELADVICRINNVELMKRLLQEILTPQEIDTLVLRWELLKLLDQGLSQREVARRLGISLCKITRGSRELKKEDSAIKKVLNSYLPRERISSKENQ